MNRHFLSIDSFSLLLLLLLFSFSLPFCSHQNAFLFARIAFFGRASCCVFSTLHSSSADHLFTSTPLHSIPFCSIPFRSVCVLKYEFNQIEFASLFRGIILFAIISLLYFWYARNTYRNIFLLLLLCINTMRIKHQNAGTGIRVLSRRQHANTVYYAYVINNAAQNSARLAIASMVSWDDIEPHAHAHTHTRLIPSTNIIHAHNNTAKQLLQSNGRLDKRGSLQSTSFPMSTMQPWVDMPRKEMREERYARKTKCAVSLLYKYFVNVYAEPIQTERSFQCLIYLFLCLCAFLRSLTHTNLPLVPCYYYMKECQKRTKINRTQLSEFTVSGVRELQPWFFELYSLFELLFMFSFRKK